MAERNPAPIDISIERSPGEPTTVTVAVRGEIDLDTSGELSAAFAALGQPTRVEVDLGGVEYMDSTGLRVLLAARSDLDDRGAEMEVVRASSIVVRLLEITGLGELGAVRLFS